MIEISAYFQVWIGIGLALYLVMDFLSWDILWTRICKKLCDWPDLRYHSDKYLKDPKKTMKNVSQNVLYLERDLYLNLRITMQECQPFNHHVL